MSDDKEHRFWRFCGLLTALALILTSPIDDAVHEWFALRHGFGPDFPVYYTGGKLARQKGDQNLYSAFSRGGTSPWGSAPPGTTWDQVTRSEGFAGMPPFITPPFSALIMEPLTLLPWQDAFLVWQLLTALITVVAVYLVFRVISVEAFDLPTFGIVIAAALSFHPYKATVHMGQQSSVILLAWALGLYMFARHRPLASALCFAIGTVIKISPAIAVPLFAMRRQWRWLAAYVFCVVVLTGFSVWHLGWQNHEMWLQRVYPALACGVENFHNRSLPGFVMALWAPRQLMGPPCLIPKALCRFNEVLTAAVYVGFLVWCWKKNKGSRGLVNELALLPLVYLLVSPFSWGHHFVLAVLPLTYLWLRSRESRVAATRIEIVFLALGTLVFGISLPDDAAIALHMSFLGVVVIGLWATATMGLTWVGMSTYEDRTRCSRAES